MDRPPPRTTSRLSILTLLAVLSTGTAAHAQRLPPDPRQGIDDFGDRFHHHHRPASPVPERVGQDVLAAVQEVVGLLMSDGRTDWSRVSITRLRQHLVDLSEIMLNAEVEERPIGGGLEILVTGDGRTLAAVRRQVPGHARRMDGFRGWQTESEELDRGVRLTLSVDDPMELEVLRGIGFFGFMASGVHRPQQLLAVARGVEHP